MVDTNEQVASAGGTSGAAESIINNNTLCDIIAQQREFQLRQEARASNMASFYQQHAARSKLQQQVEWRSSNELTGDESTAAALAAQQQQPSSAGNRKGQRRKFSLSYAMSNLTGFSSSSGAESAAASKLPTGLATHATRSGGIGGRLLQHRASLISGELVSPGEPRTSEPIERSAAEKKRGFMHKAIRRGSKMFDSMLLSSSQQQQQSAASHEQTRSSSSSQDSSDQQQQRVQFAERLGSQGDSREDQEQVDRLPHQQSGDEQPPSKPRRRRLRLGSIPHDLRRALSLSNNAHFHLKPSSCRHDQAGAADSTQSQLLQQQLVSAPLLGSSSSSAKSQDKPAAPAAPTTTIAGLRLKRKNSLFAPLSSAGSAFYHAHQRHGAAAGNAPASEHSPSSSATTQNTTPAASNSQSASFSLCQDHSRTYKLIIFGSSAVGKTSLIQRFLYGHFPELHSNKYNIPELGEIYLEILDTSGTFEFPAMRRLSIEKGDAFILVYSVADAASWEEVIHLRQLILEEKREQSEQLARQTAASAAALAAKWKLGTACESPKRLAEGQRGQQQRPDSAAASFASACPGGNSSKRQLATASQQSPAKQAGAQTAANAAADEDKLISSIYAAASRITSAANRRPLEKSMMSAGRRSSVTNQTGLVGGSDGAAGGQEESTIGPVGSMATHYNSQLSKLLQQAPASGTKGKLLQSISIEERESDGQETTTSSANRSGNKARGVKLSSSSESGRDESKSNLIGDIAQVSFASVPATDSASAAKLTPAPRRTPIVVVANKCDLDTNSLQVDQDEAERLVRDQWGNSFVKCSAKEALNIDRVFKELLRQARAPEILSQFVIDDHQQRRQSLPVLKNQLSAHHVKGLRNLYNQQQQQQTGSASRLGASSSSMGSSQQQQQEPRSMSSASEDSQCAVM